MPPLLHTLSSYVPRILASRLAHDPTLGTEPSTDHFPAAVFFADISGFTTLADRLAEHGPAGAEELTDHLNAYFGQLVDLITAHGGDVLKFAGDALLALWPASAESLQGAVQRAAQCGLAAQATLHAYEVAAGVRLSLRIGIAAGEVQVLLVGGVAGRRTASAQAPFHTTETHWPTASNAASAPVEPTPVPSEELAPSDLTSPGTIADPVLEQTRARQALDRELESRASEETKFEELRREQEAERQDRATAITEPPVASDEPAL